MKEKFAAGAVREAAAFMPCRSAGQGLETVLRPALTMGRGALCRAVDASGDDEPVSRGSFLSVRMRPIVTALRDGLSNARLQHRGFGK
jgi:hypothetical protein